MTEVNRFHVAGGFSAGRCGGTEFRHTGYATRAICYFILLSHPGFGGVDSSRVGSVIAVAHVIASLPELDELGAHLSAGDRPVRLSERNGQRGRRGQRRSESDGGNELSMAKPSSYRPRRAIESAASVLRRQLN